MFTGRKTNGFYIESGAFDGEQMSNTLFFELERNYTGICLLFAYLFAGTTITYLNIAHFQLPPNYLASFIILIFKVY